MPHSDWKVTIIFLAYNISNCKHVFANLVEYSRFFVFFFASRRKSVHTARCEIGPIVRGVSAYPFFSLHHSTKYYSYLITTLEISAIFHLFFRFFLGGEIFPNFYILQRQFFIENQY